MRLLPQGNPYTNIYSNYGIIVLQLLQPLGLKTIHMSQNFTLTTFLKMTILGWRVPFGHDVLGTLDDV
jgi:hypothetical protein